VSVADRGLPGVFESIGLADRHGLTVHDPAYLQLVLHVGGALATFDGDLRRAARAEGVELLV
jgi:predicted nucleic acid-binding protein